MKQNNLGKGLSALLKEEVFVVEKDELVKILDIEKIEAGDNQPRKKFEYEKIRELADSISNHGLLQPIIVNSIGNGKYKIIAGERRWRACKLIGITDIPVIVKDYTEGKILEIALIENIQREELSAVEEAEGLARLIEEFGYTQDKLSEIISKSRSHISNLLRLNSLPQSIKNKVNDKFLSMGHARCLVGHAEAEIISEYIIENDLNVRQTETIVKNWSKQEYVKTPDYDRHIKNKITPNSSKENELESLANALSQKFGVRIIIEDYSIGGKIIFHYGSMEELDSILSKLN
jgi:ParB family chromosome partitioning protein